MTLMGIMKLRSSLRFRPAAARRGQDERPSCKQVVVVLLHNLAEMRQEHPETPVVFDPAEGTGLWGLRLQRTWLPDLPWRWLF